MAGYSQEWNPGLPTSMCKMPHRSCFSELNTSLFNPIHSFVHSAGNGQLAHSWTSPRPTEMYVRKPGTHRHRLQLLERPTGETEFCGLQLKLLPETSSLCGPGNSCPSSDRSLGLGWMLRAVNKQQISFTSLWSQSGGGSQKELLMGGLQPELCSEDHSSRKSEDR